MKEQPNYYAIMPANVRYDKGLCAMQKIMFAEITALSNKDGFCVAGNRYFATLYGVSNETVSRWVNGLRDRGYVDVSIVRNEKKEVISRLISIPSLQKDQYPSPQKDQHPPHKKIKENNTSINTISISSPVAPEDTLKNIPYLDIVTWLNQAAQTAYKHTGQKTRKCIDARYNEGFTADDFREVIEYKAATWRSDEKMRGFLRPETLFGPKFESYLQAAQSSTHANADTALNDAILTPEEEKGYAEYIKYIHEKYMPIYRSECRVLSKSDWKDYKTCGTMPGLLTALTGPERKSLLVRVHDKLSADHHFRAKYPSVYDCYVQNARALANRQNTTV